MCVFFSSLLHLRHHLDDMSIDNFREYSSIRSANLKRARSASPVDDIYDEEQRKLFEMANSPEPNNIGEIDITIKGVQVIQYEKGIWKRLQIGISFNCRRRE